MIAPCSRPTSVRAPVSGCSAPGVPSCEMTTRLAGGSRAEAPEEGGGAVTGAAGGACAVGPSGPRRVPQNWQYDMPGVFDPLQRLQISAASGCLAELELWGRSAFPHAVQNLPSGVFTTPQRLQRGPSGSVRAAAAELASGAAGRAWGRMAMPSAVGTWKPRGGVPVVPGAARRAPQSAQKRRSARFWRPHRPQVIIEALRYHSVSESFTTPESVCADRQRVAV
jgi:hypothetical protein